MGQSRSHRTTSTRTVYETLKAQIEEGLYGLGARLPSTRMLALELGASRTTISAAYEQLAAEGYIDTSQGRHARVSTRPAPKPSSSSRRSGRSKPRRLSRLAGLITSFQGSPSPVEAGRLAVDFRYGDVAASDFPLSVWRRALKVASQQRRGSLRYGAPQGIIELRSALQAYLWRGRGLRCEAEQIVVVNGSQQGLDLCARLLLDPGDRFIIEDPCYVSARQIFQAVGAVPVEVPVDHEGMQTTGLNEIKQARLCYVTPSHQFPLGGVLTAPRRQQLLAWAERAGAYIVEDDYDGEFRYDIRPVPPLQALDHRANVIYLGTVSKTLSPLLRLGYLVVPGELVAAFSAAKRLADRHAPALEQRALAELINTGAYERHIRRARRRNADRRATLLAAFSDGFGDAVTIEGSDAGLHVVVWVNGLSQNQEARFAETAREAGVGIYPISPLYSEAKRRRQRGIAGFVVGYAALDERAIRRGIMLLAKAFS
ncbi:PLP-dependent aminotransferase family protein [Hyphomicrobium sp. 802]|uniref:MocR-like pyridoxine biosynthesis transcription factor PdxR n=1 Tax=Hyphomicrobium sp. 802 TaxID=1112272 RepID=UPI00045E6EFC|nr:PLP-dependent aminotransferase family protein [Hyphomicrobium sp. 802]